MLAIPKDQQSITIFHGKKMYIYSKKPKTNIGVLLTYNE